jgi:putative phage-type endonuclease
MIDRLLNKGVPVDDVRARLAHVLDDVVAAQEIEDRLGVRNRMRDHVAKLPKGIEQRTPEWYAARESLITASNFNEASARPEAFLKKKLDAKAFKGSDATRWGVKYEEVANLMYCHYNATEVLEYGLLLHPVHAHLGASPDGITPYGVMIEIKCPYTKTLADIPDDYYAQMQGQMECTGLTECDFVVCRVKELTEAEFWAMRADPAVDAARLGTVTHNAEYTKFAFSRPAMTDAQVREHLDVQDPELRTTYHHVWKFAVTRVDKDEAYWAAMLPKLRATWGMLNDRLKGGGEAQPAPTAHAFSFKMF